MKKILIIKLSALGDVILATSAFKAVRAHHPHDHITLMTTAPYVELAKQMNLFDTVIAHKRPKIYEIRKLWNLRTFLTKTGFSRIYDFQLVDRTNWYFKLMGEYSQKIEWVGSAKKCAYPYCDPQMLKTYVQDRYKCLLFPVGIKELPPLNVENLGADPLKFDLPSPYVLLVPGASNAYGGKKKWPLALYAELAQALSEDFKLRPVLIGGGEEDCHIIKEKCPQAIDLTGKTSIQDVIGIAAQACLAIGNDTGPMHIAGACSIPVITLFCGEHNPAVVGPRGAAYCHLQKQNIEDITVGEVLTAVRGVSEEV